MRYINYHLSCLRHHLGSLYHERFSHCSLELPFTSVVINLHKMLNRTFYLFSITLMKYKTWNSSHNFRGFYWNVLQGNRVYYNDIGYFFATVIYYLSKVNLGVTHDFITNLSRRQRHYCSLFVSHRYLPIVSLYQIKLHWVNKYSLKLTLKRKVFLRLNFVVFIKRKKKIGSDMSSLPESKKLHTGQVYTKVKNVDIGLVCTRLRKGYVVQFYTRIKKVITTQKLFLFGGGKGVTSLHGDTVILFLTLTDSGKKLNIFLEILVVDRKGPQISIVSDK